MADQSSPPKQPNQRNRNNRKKKCKDATATPAANRTKHAEAAQAEAPKVRVYKSFAQKEAELRAEAAAAAAAAGGASVPIASGLQVSTIHPDYMFLMATVYQQTEANAQGGAKQVFKLKICSADMHDTNVIVDGVRHAWDAWKASSGPYSFASVPKRLLIMLDAEVRLTGWGKAPAIALEKRMPSVIAAIENHLAMLNVTTAWAELTEQLATMVLPGSASHGCIGIGHSDSQHIWFSTEFYERYKGFGLKIPRWDKPPKDVILVPPLQQPPPKGFEY